LKKDKKGDFLLQAMDAEKRQQIIQEISIMKGLSTNDNIVKFVAAATVDASSRWQRYKKIFITNEEYT
jgi:hypothetical protein